MIDRSHPLPLTKQARAAGISRGSVYYLPKPVPAADLALMRRIDELHLELPFAGSRMLNDLLNAQGVAVGTRVTRSTRTCCAIGRSRRRTKPGRWTSPTSRWRAVSSTWPR